MLLSIITVTLNASGHLPGLVQSIRNQGRFDDVEWVVVDGASTDGTVDILRDNSDVVTRWISERDCGLYDALNKAVRLARGEFYVVLGADDRFDPGAFARMTDELKAAPDGDAWCFSVRRSGQMLVGREATRMRRAIGWMRFNSSHSVGTVFRTSLHHRFGFYSTKYAVLADGHFMLKLVDSGIRFKNVQWCVGEFVEGGATSIDDVRLIAETWLIQIHLGHSLWVQTLLFLARVARLSLRGSIRQKQK